MIKDRNLFRQEYKHAQGWWADSANAKQTEANNLSWDTTRGGWTFTNNSNRFLWLVIQMQHSKILGTDVEPHIHWQPTTTDTDTVQWQLKYWFLNQVSGGAQDATGTSETITVTPNGTAFQLQVDDWTAIAAPANEEISSLFICEVARLGDADDYNSDVILKDFDVHLQKDQPGSYGERTKWGNT